MTENELLLICVLAVIGTIFLTREIFSIGTIVKQLKVQTKLLSLIAEKNGVDSAVVSEASSGR